MSKVGVTASRWTALPTKIGRLFMKRLYWAHIILSSTFVLALGACVHKPTKPLDVDQPVEQVSPLSQQDSLLQEARIESEDLRAELGALKILMAKQAGELQSLKGRSQSIHHREHEQGLQLQQIRSELLSSQAERDQLRKRNMELEGQVASMPDTSELVSDIQALTSSFQQIMTSMKQLTADMTLIKREIHITSGKLEPRKTTLTTPKQHTSFPERQTPDSNGRIVIQDGDTLWKLSKQYHVSVAQLQEWNGIESDLIVTGLRLRVTTPTERQVTHEHSPVEAPVPPVSQAHVNEPVQQQKSIPESIPAQNAKAKSVPETKHILSLGSPHSNSHESSP
jgi:LysM repeat protein